MPLQRTERGEIDHGGGGGEQQQQPRRTKTWVALLLGVLLVAAAVGIAFGVLYGGATTAGSSDKQTSSMPGLDGVKDVASSSSSSSSTAGGKATEDAFEPVAEVPSAGSSTTTPAASTTTTTTPKSNEALLNLIEKLAGASTDGLASTVSFSSPLFSTSSASTAAALPDILQVAQSKNSAKLTSLVDKLLNATQQSRQLDAALAQFTKAVTRTATCQPKDAAALRQALAEKCLYIKLSPGTRYVLLLFSFLLHANSPPTSPSSLYIHPRLLSSCRLSTHPPTPYPQLQPDHDLPEHHLPRGHRGRRVGPSHPRRPKDAPGLQCLAGWVFGPPVRGTSLLSTSLPPTHHKNE